MLLNQKLHSADGTQCALYPGKTMALTQGVDGEYSHTGAFALDDAGEDALIDRDYAPWDMKCVWKDAPGGVNGVNFHTLTPVLCADGVKRHVTYRKIHDNYIGDIQVGQVFKQGEVVGHEGTAGKATGNHRHIHFAEGLLTGQGLVKNRFGVWELKNEIEPWRVCFTDGTILKRTLGYAWRTYAQFVEHVKAQMAYVGLATKVEKEAIDEVFLSPTGLKITVQKNLELK